MLQPALNRPGVTTEIRMERSSMSEAQRQCIEDCLECHAVCLETAMGHCLEMGGRHVEAQHMRLMLSCARICQTAADFMLGRSPLHAVVCEACAQVCEACADSCEEIGDMEECVEICRACAESCYEMAEAAE